MNRKDILSKVDHTLLSVSATADDIKALCDDGVKYGVASVCIPPAFVSMATRYLAGKLPVCTVIGFPNGYNTTAVKCFETSDAIENGAEEIDMVIPVGKLKAGENAEVAREIYQIKKACQNKILKVIIETCLLTEEEKIRMCKIVSESGADFIKTSTGFAGGGATPEDITLFAAHVSPHVKIKAAGGISSFEDAAAFLEAGAHRLGTSRLVRILKQEANL